MDEQQTTTTTATDPMVERLANRTGEGNAELLSDLLETAKYAILARRYPFGDLPVDEQEQVVLEPRWKDLQFRVALDLYNKMGAEGETEHRENGIDRTYQSSWISEQLLSEVTPLAKVPS